VGRDPSAALHQGACRSAEFGGGRGAASRHDPAGDHSSEPPVYRCAPAGSKLDPFKDEICRLKDDLKLPGVRVRELLQPLGCTASKTVVDDNSSSTNARGLASTLLPRHELRP